MALHQGSEIGNMQKSILKTASVTFLALMMPLGAVYAQSMTSGEILNALKPKQQKATSATRSFSATRSIVVAPEKNDTRDAVSADDRTFIRTLGATRAIRVEQRDKLIAIVEKSDLPSINIQILFAYDSDKIEGTSFADLNEVGEALLDPSLANSKIMLNGHTDAAGSEVYNQDLSERRASSVKRYLTEKFFVPADRILVSGFGEERLQDPDNPNSGKNRRVEIVNLGE